MPTTTAVLTFTGAYRDRVVAGFPLGKGYRWFLPSLMRFNARDSLSPFGLGGPNPYAYCDEDPINRADPSGHMNINPDQLDGLQRISATSGTNSGPAEPAAVPTGATDGPIAANQAANVREPHTDAANPGQRSARQAQPPRTARLPVGQPANLGGAANNWRQPANRGSRNDNWRQPPAGQAAVMSDADRSQRIQAATSLLSTPPAYELGPIFAHVPSHDWETRGYRVTLTIGWKVTFGDEEMRVLAHVHYARQDDAWRKFGGNAWISGVKNWQYRTTPAVVAMAPDSPPDEPTQASVGEFAL